MRHRYVFLTSLAIVAAGLVFSLYGNYSGTNADFIMKNGWVMMPVSYTHLDVYKRQPKCKDRVQR